MGRILGLIVATLVFLKISDVVCKAAGLSTAGGWSIWAIAVNAFLLVLLLGGMYAWLWARQKDII